ARVTGFGSAFPIVNCDVDDERAEIGPAEPLDDLAVARQWTSSDVQPRAPVIVVDEVGGLGNERVAFPAPNGVALIPGIRFGIGRAPVKIHLADGRGRALVYQDDLRRSLHD